MTTALQRFKNVSGIYGFGEVVVCVAGWSLGYAFANPDKHKGWQFFPSFTQNKFLYITRHSVDADQVDRFLFHWKNLARYCQQQPGYLYTRLLQAKNLANSEVQFVHVTTWLTASDQKQCMRKPTAHRLIKRMLVHTQQKDRHYTSTLHKVLVDDSQYVPPI